VCGAVSKTFGCKSVDDNWAGLNFYSVVHVGSWSTSGIITDDSETFWLDNLESEVVGGTCGAPDRGGVSKNGSNNLLDCVRAESQARRVKMTQKTPVAL